MDIAEVLVSTAAIVVGIVGSAASASTTSASRRSTFAKLLKTWRERFSLDSDHCGVDMLRKILSEFVSDVESSSVCDAEGEGSR